jgi:nicotinamide-nucleotide amidase
VRATVITIGNELLSGRTSDLNLAYLARALGEVGVRVVRHLTIGDERAAMMDAVRGAERDCELVVLSGGLGPTADDLTREVMAELAGAPLIEDPKLAARLAANAARRGRPLTNVGRRQAWLPAGIETLRNPVGEAPGLWLEREGRVVCALPGVPGELQAMTRESLLPRLRALRGPGSDLHSVTLRTLGVSEAVIAQRVEDDAIDLAGIELAYLPHIAGVDLRIAGLGAGAEESVARVEAALAERFATAIYARGREDIEEVVFRLLRERGLRLAIAESCTGGLVSYRVTRVPGSSEVFVGGVVAYADAIKATELGVPAELLTTQGAVSADVAVAMAEGAALRFGADVGLAVTGIAGPGGGSEAKPVGLVFVGLARRESGGEAESDSQRELRREPPSEAGSKAGSEAGSKIRNELGKASRRLLLFGDRHQIRERAAVLALECLRRSLLGFPLDSSR